MYMTQSQRKLLSNMVLAHRVAVRRLADAEKGTAEWFDALTSELATEYAVELALGTGHEHQREFLAESKDQNSDSEIAVIRLARFGVEV